MFEDDLDRLVSEIGISQGELLALARVIAQDDTLRTTNRLTAAERRELLLVIEHQYATALA